MKARAAAALLAVAVGAAADLAFAAPPEHGTVTGTVRLHGTPPDVAPAKIAKDAAVCGKEAASEAVRLGPNRELADVVVFLKSPPAPGAVKPTPAATLDQVACRYVPHVQAVTVGTELALLNNDPVFHNVHARFIGPDKETTAFNVAMPLKGQRLTSVLKKPGLYKARCDAGHSWMSAYVHVFEHPFFAVTDEKGAFTIDNVPAGEHEVELWHEPVPGTGPAPLRTTIKVRIKAGEATRTTVDLDD